ncbi:SDR family NAD(P)-dependent oxidoreductase [Actinokineospora soli]|uniref:SDR family NAD(P)-dependent oxidoreductase n=1 Tax=Actinokineospora soli TaxID=1048753 RepID=A0ABW2TXS9_9PSEU
MRTRPLAGTVVAVTGGAAGSAIAEAVAGAGAAVVMGAVDGDAVRVAASVIAGRTGAAVVGARLDVAQAEWFSAFLEHAESECGPVDVLVNSAGVEWAGAFDDEPDEVAQRQFAVNVLGVVNGMKLAIPGMRRRGGGHVVNVAGAGVAATEVATRCAVRGYSAAVRAQVRGSGVRVSVVVPSERRPVAAAVLGVILRGRRAG